MHIGFHDKNENNPGELSTRLSYDASNVNNIVLSSMGVLIIAIILVLISAIISFHYNWKLAIIGFLTAPLSFFASYVYFKQIENESDGNEESEFRAGSFLSECVCNTKILLSFNFGEKAVKIYKEILSEPYKDLIKDSIIKGLIYGFSQAISFMIFSVSFYFAASYIAEGSAKFGDCIKVILVMSEAFFEMGFTMQYIGDLQRANESLKNLTKTQNEKSLQDPFAPKQEYIYPQKICGKIEFRNVSFSYPTRRKLVLKNLSFIIKPGQIAAFVGQSGSGKSTFVQLLERFYDISTDDLISSGEILIDDVDIKKYDPECLRKFISLVGQEPAIFKRSVKENIKYGKLNALENEIQQAAEKAQIEHLLNQDYSDLPVSGGEKQRIAIARAIMRDPIILLLDEATSALDKNTEMEIQKSIEKIMNQRTSIIIAHRYNFYLGFFYFLNNFYFSNFFQIVDD